MAAAAALLLAGCGGSSPSPRTTVGAFVRAWSSGHWTAMRAQVVDPPKDFVSINASVFTGLGVSHASVSAGRVRTAKSGTSARAQIIERYQLADVGSWSITSTIHLVRRGNRWRVRWTPATIDPKLVAGAHIAVGRNWPARAAILGAGGVKLTTVAQQVVVGVVGQRIKKPGAVRADLLAAGAPRAPVAAALAAARQHPSYFEPIFTITQARFTQLKAVTGPTNVYNVPGTQFEASGRTVAITKQLSAHLVGSVGPITAEQLKALGAPYDASSTVGQTGIQASAEKTLAGAPTTVIGVDNAAGVMLARLASFPGRNGTPVTTSIDPRIQRAAEAALATATHHDVSMVAIDAPTGRVLAVVSDPITTYDTAFQGAYAPGSTFKVLTSSALIQNGLNTSSPASCPPTITVDGEVFHNAEGDQPVSTLAQAFIESCNTAFIGLATKHLTAADFPAVARLYGLQRTPELGVPAFMDNIPKPASQTELAGDSIGQGSVTFSALGMATVAAAIDSGVVRAPRLVAGAPDDSIASAPLPAAVVADLRTMMASVVSSGTAAGQGLPAGTYAKTGTAEYGTGPASKLKIDGWLMGYRGNVAFAIVTHDTGGGNGGPVNGPIIARFLNAIG
ncbi:MAG TPA: penicillin-binding transpeptidase domain-containing protein [Solirubrobacteraceae bacterium]|nr:penicillin-binding transpeptidase domain-containing protein [Solirubrobacteraceae bacterium]